MRRLNGRWPSFLRQVAVAACLLILGGLAPRLSAQPKRFRPAPQYVQIGKPDQEEGKRILTELRRTGLGIAGSYYLEFQLRVMPRQGPERLVTGQLWGGRNDRGPLTRLVVSPGDEVHEQRLLIQLGAQSAAWSWRKAEGGKVSPLGGGALFERLGETDLAAFDLEMPFIYWTDFVFEGVANVRGRPAHVFLLYPPPDVVAQKPELTGVRLYLDTQANAMVQSEQIGAADHLLKSVSLRSIQTVRGQTLPKSLELRDDVTRNKTGFSITAAAIGIDLSPTLFEPAMLAESIKPPSGDKIDRLNP